MAISALRLPRIKGFDGLRGFSILFVLFSHGEIYERLGIAETYLARFGSGGMGVRIFFVLSGFLITLLLINEQRETGRIDLFKFYARRAIRLLPLFYLAIAVVVVLTAMGLASPPRCGIVWTSLYLNNFQPRDCRYMSFNHFWSLAAEEHFYLVWPFLLLSGRRIAITASIAFIVLAATLGASPFVAFAPTYSIDDWTFPKAFSIAFGCLAAFAVTDERVIGQLRSKAARTILLCSASAAFFSEMNLFLTCGGIALLIVYIVIEQESLIVRLLECRPLRYIGTISYGVYVWQGIFTGNGGYRPDGVAFPPSLDTGLLLTAVVAPLSYHFFERPILRLKDRFRTNPNRASK